MKKKFIFYIFFFGIIFCSHAFAGNVLPLQGKLNGETKKAISEKMKNIFGEMIITIEKIERLAPSYQLFEPFILFRIGVLLTPGNSDSFSLQYRLTPIPATEGLFAYNGERLLYLGGGINNLEYLFKINKRLVNSSRHASDIANIVIMTQLERNNEWCHLVTDGRDVLRLEKKFGYQVDRDKFKMYKKMILHPEWLVGNSVSCLKFFCIGVTQNNGGTLREMKVEIEETTGRIKILSHDLVFEIFSDEPRVISLR